MRTARRAVRDVRLPRLFAGPWQLPRCHCLRISPQTARYFHPGHTRVRRTLCPPKSLLRAYATARGTPSAFTPNEYHVAAVDASHQPRELGKIPLIQCSEQFGKWAFLVNNPERLAVETDFHRKGAGQYWHSLLLVDHSENDGDFELWSCLLNYLQRIHGDPGVLMLWSALWGRKALYQTESPMARIFWQTILEAAVSLGSRKALDSVWIYAEWMVEYHDTTWPNLYMTVVSYFLRTHQHNEALRWHIRLSPNFYPGPRQFSGLLQEYSADKVLNSAFTLRSLYIASPERKLYDIMVPHLYARGQAILARLWRRICIQHGDEPNLHAPNRPFLRYLQAFWSDKGTIELPFSEQELIVLRHKIASHHPEQVKLSREFMNRVTGAASGASANTYNDGLGARWFASRWLSLNSAISFVAGLDIKTIGPLSFQSIALREDSSEGILARIAQLKDLGIGIAEGNYVDTVCFLARIRFDGLLSDVLHCDIHPEVFDDLQLQARLIEASAAAGDWRNYQVLVGARLATIEKTTHMAANTLLETYMRRGDYEKVLRVLHDMRSLDVSLSASLSEAFFGAILDDIPDNTIAGEFPSEKLDQYVSMCLCLNMMEIPVPVVCWRRILYCLGRTGRLDELHELCFWLLDYFQNRASARPGFVSVHISDIPKPMKDPTLGGEKLIGLYIPQDTPVRLSAHPLARIFNSNMLSSMVRWAFRRTTQRTKAVALIDPSASNSHVARTISVFRLLYDCGFKDTNFVPRLQKWIKLRLADIYGEAPATKTGQRAVRRFNVLTLEQMKAVCDRAWGEELLPSIEELRSRVASADRTRVKTCEKYAKRKKRQDKVA